MILHILRALFVLLMTAVGWFFLKHRAQPLGDMSWIALLIAIVVAIVFVVIDVASPRKKLAIFSGTILGLLVGLFVAYGLSFLVDMLVDQYVTRLPEPSTLTTAKERETYSTLLERREALIMFINVTIGMVCTYLAISFILQTKDDFRFIIPYVEFRKQLRGPRPILVDTSAIIDGRILDIAETGFIESRLIVPRFVLQELQMVADNGDKLKRNRGRRGLEVLNKLQGNRKVEVIIYDWTPQAGTHQDLVGADQKLLALAKELNARILSTDSNLKQVAQVREVEVVNLHELASALRPVVLPGERMTVKLVKPGEEASQGVGFLDDGTMVVVKDGRAHLNEEVEFTVTNVLQTTTGRMIFGQIGESGGVRRPRQQPHQQPAARVRSGPGEE
jgi:uncharacterized protein YacL